MSLNGSGTYSPNTAGQPVATGQTIDATVFNALINDIASALSTAIFKDGQQTVTANIPMGGYKITGLATGTATTDAAAVQNVNARSMCEGRLTLTTGVPVTTSDVTAAETLYFTPYKGSCIALYDGTNWVRRTFTEVSIDVPDATNCYDVFAYDNSGTVTLELTAWTNTTTRATALTTQDGVLVKTGALTRRYLGTFYCTTAGNGQIEDSAANRYLWNYYNRVRRTMARPIQGSLTYQYTTATYRQANANTGNQLNFVIGVAEDMVSAYSVHSASSSGAEDAILFYQAIGYDATNAAATGCCPGVARSNSATTVVQLANATYNGYPAVGAHYLSFLEQSTASGTTSWGGLVNDIGEGIYGELWG